VNAIVHSHAPYTLVFGATDVEMRAVSHDGAWFEGRLGRFTATSDTITDAATAESVAKALGDDPALLLRNHGGVIVGSSIRHVVVGALTLERACRLQLMCEHVPSGYHTPTAGDVAGKLGSVYGDAAVRPYRDHCVHQVARRWPETAGWAVDRAVGDRVRSVFSGKRDYSIRPTATRPCFSWAVFVGRGGAAGDHRGRRCVV
jgi:L-fuculose-phosphate aldolase